MRHPTDGWGCEIFLDYIPIAADDGKILESKQAAVRKDFPNDFCTTSAQSDGELRRNEAYGYFPNDFYAASAQPDGKFRRNEAYGCFPNDFYAASAQPDGKFRRNEVDECFPCDGNATWAQPGDPLPGKITGDAVSWKPALGGAEAA